MRKILLLISSLIAITATAQKSNIRVDDFTGEKVITTSWEKIYGGGLTATYQTRSRLRHENGNDYIEFRIFTDEVVSCSKGKSIMLKTDDNIVTAINTEYVVAGMGDWSPIKINNNLGIYIISKIDLSTLNGKMVRKIRFNLNDGYVDIELKKDGSEKLAKMVALIKDNL